VLTCSNVVHAGASLENYLAMRKAIADYGAYPTGGRLLRYHHVEWISAV